MIKLYTTILIIILYTISPAKSLTGDKCRIIVGLTHALSNNKDFGGCIEFQDGKFKLNEHFLKMQLWAAATSGANAVRILPECPFDIQPHKQQLTRFFWNGKKYNLMKSNPEYSPILKRIKNIAINEYNMEFHYDIFDQVQHQSSSVRDKMSPWREHNNIQGFHNYQHSLLATKKLVAEAVDTLKKRGVVYSLGNEIIMLEKNPINWTYEAMKVLIDKEIAPNRIAYGANGLNHNHRIENKEDIFTVKNDQAKEFWQALKDSFLYAHLGKKNIDGISDSILLNVKNKRTHVIRQVHWFGRKQPNFAPFNGWGVELGPEAFTVIKTWTMFKSSVIFSDDGVFNGDGLEWEIPGEDRAASRPSCSQWTAMVIYCLSQGFDGGFEHLPIDRDNYGYNRSVFRAISEGYKNKYGIYPENYGKYSRPKKPVIEPVKNEEVLPEKNDEKSEPDKTEKAFNCYMQLFKFFMGASFAYVIYRIIKNNKENKNV